MVAGAPSDVTAPASFKGFAANLNAGTPLDVEFTTGTGNSSNPPAGPLPDQMCVLVADMVVQSGSTISGDVVGWALALPTPVDGSRPRGDRNGEGVFGHRLP